MGFVLIEQAVRERAGFPVHAAEPAAQGAEPEGPGPIFIQYADAVVAETFRVSRIIAVNGGPAVSAVKKFKSAAIGAKPQVPRAVGEDAADGAIPRAIGVAGEEAEVGIHIFQPIEPVQTGLGPDPERPRRVLPK
jgi:hypothetical protein